VAWKRGLKCSNGSYGLIFIFFKSSNVNIYAEAAVCEILAREVVESYRWHLFYFVAMMEI